MTARTRGSTRAKASGDDSTSSDRLPFAPSHRSRETEATAATAAAASSGAADNAMERPRRLHPYHRSPRSACPFDGLAAVEVQAIMQMLDHHSLMRLARCSRRMHVDADSDAAWSSQPPFEVRLERGTGALVAGRFHHSLLSHVAATRIQSRPSNEGSHILLDEDIDAMLTLRRITELENSWNIIPLHEWRRILHHPATAGLTALTTGWHTPYDVFNHLVHLPRLHTLDLRLDVDGARPLDVSAFSSLPSLTSLTVRALKTVRHPSMLPAMAGCRHLTHLRFVGVRMIKGEFRRLLTSPNMSRLEELEMAQFLTTLAAEEYADAFAAMIHLRHLELYRVQGVDSLLAGLSRAPHLATVKISPDAPSVAVLQSLFERTETTSRVHVTLRLLIDIDLTAFASLDPQRLTLLTV